MAKGDSGVSAPSPYRTWLQNTLTVGTAPRSYRHRLLKEDQAKRKDAFDHLAKYVFQAHEDARRHLRSLASSPLDPFGASSSFDPASGYPQRLHIHTLQGYFGEILAGLVAQHFSPCDDSAWEVPAFLFRFHVVAFQQLEALPPAANATATVPGRTGDDCLAFRRDGTGRIIKILYCEAKCTADHDTAMIAAAHDKAATGSIVDIPRLVEILKDYADPASIQWVHALLQLWFSGDDGNCERCDLVIYVCGRSPIKGTRQAWLPSDRPHASYTAGRKIEAVEVHLTGVSALVSQVYGKRT
jgi:hypothetical protein